MDAYLDASPAGRPRVGIVVPVHGHTLVERNRLRRRLREVVRRAWLPQALRRGVSEDIVLLARPAAYDTPYRRLRASVLEALGGDRVEDPDPAPDGPSELPCRAG